MKALFVAAVAIEGILAIAVSWGLAMIVAGLYVAAFLLLRIRAAAPRQAEWSRPAEQHPA